MKVVLIGAGNVGFHLGRRLHECGVKIIQVFSREESKAMRLARLLDAGYTDDLSRILDSADLYLVAVNDDSIGDVLKGLPMQGLKDKLFAHTSGATPMNVFSQPDAPDFKRYGIFYPLQTFSLAREPDFSRIPVFVDANNDKDLDLLEHLALSVSPIAHRLTEEQRTAVHVAAVFVNNFTNHLFHVGKTILDNENLPFDLLMPLIQETVAKLKLNEPALNQTGPAIRGDESTIERHLEFLVKYPVFSDVYRALTKSIQVSMLQKSGNGETK